MRTWSSQLAIILFTCTGLARAQAPSQAASPGAAAEPAQKYVVPARTRVPMVLVNSVSTKTSQIGDQVYLQTSFPISANGRIVIPEGSYVTGTITEVKRPGKVKGRSEIYLRFDTLMLSNGVRRDFRGTVSATDGSQDTMSEKEGRIVGDSSKGQDAATIAAPSVTGAAIGAGVDEGKGAGIGAGAGAVVGMIGVLLTRGNEVKLLRGTSIEMKLDRDITFNPEEVSFSTNQPPLPLPTESAPAQGTINDSTLRRGVGLPGLPWP